MTTLPPAVKKKNTNKYAAVALVLILLGAVVIFFSLDQLLFAFNSSNPEGFTPIRVNHWSGYLVSLGSIQNRTEGVSSVSATWTVPQIEYSDNDTYSSVWVGIGGYGEESLIQAGTEHQCVNGEIEYFAWYELLPDYIVRIPNVNVNPGDVVSVSISQVNQYQRTWRITVNDLTNGGHFEISNVVYYSSQKSAEWIVERPMVNKTTSELANFGEAFLKDCTSTINGTLGNIGSFYYTPIVMADTNDNQLTSTTRLSEDGAGFNVTYINPATNSTLNPAST